MCNRAHIRIALGVILLLSMAVSATGAVLQGSIYLVNGESFQGIKMTVNKTFGIVEINLLDEKKSISFHKIALIIDKDGNDVTRSLTGRDSRTPSTPASEGTASDLQAVDSAGTDGAVPDSLTKSLTPPAQTLASPSGEQHWLSKTDPRIADYNRSPWTFALWMHGNFSLPISNYYDGLDGGADFGGGVSIAINRQIALKFDLERNGMNYSRATERALRYISIDPNYEIISQNHEVSVSRYLMGAQWINQKSLPEEKIQMFYLSTGLGQISHTFKSSVTVREVSSGDQEHLSGKEDISHFMIYTGGGAVLSLSKSVGIDIGVNLDMIFVGTDRNGVVQEAYNLDFRLGLVLLL